MHTLRLFPRRILRRNESQDDIEIHISSGSCESDLARPAPRRRRMSLRLPHWRSTKRVESEDAVDDAPALSHKVHLAALNASPSKTLCSISGASASGDEHSRSSPSPRARKLSLLQEPVLDTAPFIRESLLFSSSEEAVARAAITSRTRPRRSSHISKPLPSVPAPVPATLPYPSLPTSESPTSSHRSRQPSPRRTSCSSYDTARSGPDQDDEDEELKRSARLKPGTKVRNGWESFKIEYLVNIGGFGYVYRARSRKGETVAIKVMAKDWLSCRGESLETAKVEFEILRRVSEERRDFMTQLLCSWADEHNIYFVMRYYAADLSGLIANVDKAIFPFSLYVAELTSAVSYMHEMGYIHLDIKPENILVSPSGHLALADFGLAHRVTPESPYCTNPCGTVCYEAPEVMAENLFGMSGCDQRADVWSLGIVILQMFAHHVCAPHERRGDFSADKRLRTLVWDPRKLWEMKYIETHVPELHHLLCQMLERDPRLRIDMKAVKAHSYFRGVDWSKLAEVQSIINVHNDDKKAREPAALPSPSATRDPKYQPRRKDSKPIHYDFNYRCPPELRALGDIRHGTI